MFNFRKKPIITVTFDPYHNLPMMQAKNCTEEQIRDAVLFMQGHVRIDAKRPSRYSKNRRRKKENRIHKFFRILGVIIFGNNTSRVEERTKRPDVNCHHVNCRHSFTPLYPEKRINEPVALSSKV